MANALVILRQAVSRYAQDAWETRTDIAGLYRFWGVAPGTYQLGVQLPEGYGTTYVQWQTVKITTEEDNLLVLPIAALRLDRHIYIPIISR